MTFSRLHFFIFTLLSLTALFFITQWNLEPFRKNENTSNKIQKNTSYQESTLNSKNTLSQANLKNKKLFFFNQKQIKKISNGILISFFLSSGILIFLILYIVFGLLKPIQNLNKKMIALLNNKYKYRFQSTPSNELGDLEETFHALAQRVIFRMEELTSLDQTKSEFLSIASHELRTPLTSIKGSLNLLKTGMIGRMDEPCLEILNLADEETDRLIRLINDILDLTKIESGSLPLEKKWQPLIPLLEKALNNLKGMASKAEVELKMESVNRILVYMDSDRIHQVLVNLLSNAIQHTRKKSTVLLQAYVENAGKLKIKISDQGPGIHFENQKLIFNKFFQATASKPSISKGTGLGLTIAKNLVEKHKGEIGLKSTLGKGSDFYFTLPKWKWDKQETLLKKEKSLPNERVQIYGNKIH